MRNIVSVQLRETRNAYDRMLLLLQGLPGFIGPFGETGIAGEKVCTVSICHTVLASQPVLYSVQFNLVYCILLVKHVIRSQTISQHWIINCLSFMKQKISTYQICRFHKLIISYR